MLDLQEIADLFDADVSALKLLLTIYIGYIFAALHRAYFFDKSAAQQHFFCTLAGVSLIYWNYGYGTINSVICIVAQWLIFKLIGTSKACMAVSFSFQMIYLVAGYVLTATEGYDINWSMPHCILTLRLIGLSWDVYDGHRDQDELTPEQKTLCIKDVPSLLEMFGFCYFYGGCHVGPQFSARRYRQLVNGELTDNKGKVPNSVIPALRRGLSGTIFLLLYLVCNGYFPESSYFQPEFTESGFFWKVLVIGIRGHVLFYQYISLWMINEGACILCGLGFYKEGEKVKWDAVRNVKLGSFITARCFQDFVSSFNINTNQWVARYVFKRLRFLGNKTISHLSTLFFLAVWHGYHEGYFTCFFYEYITLTVERPVRAELNESSLVKSLKSSKYTSWILTAVSFLYVKFLFGYCILDFSLRKWNLYAPIYISVYYYGHLFYLTLWVLLQIHLSNKRKLKDDTKKE